MDLRTGYFLTSTVEVMRGPFLKRWCRRYRHEATESVDSEQTTLRMLMN